MGCGHECVSQRDESLPVGQSQRAWVEEFVLRLLVELLPARDPGRVDLDDAVTDCLFHDADEDAVGDHPYGEMTECGHHARPPSREIRVEVFNSSPRKARSMFTSPYSASLIVASDGGSPA
jgi:hypothetical protein